MKKLYHIIRKNFKLMLRSRTSALIIFLGPLLLVSLLGLAFSQSSSFKITAGTYTESYSALTEEVITALEDHDFKIKRYKSLEGCVDSLQQGHNDVCLRFPEDMEITEGRTNDIEFHLDYSQINLVWIIVNIMNEQVTSEATSISTDLTTDLLGRVKYTEEQLKVGKGLLEKVQASQQKATSEGDAAQQTSSNMALKFDISDLDVDSLVNHGEIATDMVANIQTGLLGDLTSLQEDLTAIESDLRDAVGEAGAASGDVASAADDVENAAEDLSTLVEDSGEDADSLAVSVEAISDVLNQVKNALGDAEKKLKNADTARNTVVNNIGAAISELDSAKTNTAQLITINDNILTKLGTLKITSAEQIVSPITTTIKPINTEGTHFFSLLPALMVLIITITGILLASTTTIVEKRSKAFFRNHITPTSVFTFNIGTYVTSLIIIVTQLILFIAVSIIFFDMNILASLAEISLLLLLISTLFIIIGMFIGFVFNNEETTTLAAITVASLFMLFSNTVIPLESMPETLQNIAAFNPFVIGEEALRQVIIFDLGLQGALTNIYFLVGYCVVLFGLMVGLEELFKRLALHHFKTPFQKKGKLALFSRKKSEKIVDTESHEDIDKRISETLTKLR